MLVFSRHQNQRIAVADAQTGEVLGIIEVLSPHRNVKIGLDFVPGLKLIRGEIIAQNNSSKPQEAPVS